jgi:hypothetical protein
MDTTIDYVSRYLYRNVTGNIPSALAEPKLADNALQVYPNPATNWVTVNHPVESIKRMALFSLNGQLLQQWFGSDLSITVHLNQFTSGLYLLQVETTKQTFVKKLKID